MNLKQLFGEDRIRQDAEVSEYFTARIVELLLVGWTFSGQSSEHFEKLELIFHRKADGEPTEVTFVSLDGDFITRIDHTPPYDRDMQEEEIA